MRCFFGASRTITLAHSGPLVFKPFSLIVPNAATTTEQNNPALQAEGATHRSILAKGIGTVTHISELVHENKQGATGKYILRHLIEG